jgi:hypothetical protein
MENGMNNIPPEVSPFTFLSAADRPEWDDAKHSWRQLHNEELSNLCPFSDILLMIRLRRIKCEGT